MLSLIKLQVRIITSSSIYRENELNDEELNEIAESLHALEVVLWWGNEESLDEQSIQLEINDARNVFRELEDYWVNTLLPLQDNAQQNHAVLSTENQVRIYNAKVILSYFHREFSDKVSKILDEVRGYTQEKNDVENFRKKINQDGKVSKNEYPWFLCDPQLAQLAADSLLEKRRFIEDSLKKIRNYKNVANNCIRGSEDYMFWERQVTFQNHRRSRI